MKNYALEWKKFVNLKELSYDNFIKDFESISSAFYLEKIDGMLGMVIYEKGKDIYFQTTTGAIIKDLPVLKEYLQILNKNEKIKSIILAGELIAIKNNKMLEWGNSQSIIKTSYLESNKKYIHHYVYDIFLLNNNKLQYNDAIKELNKIFNFKITSYIHFPEYEFGNIKDFSNIYNKVVNIKSGVEGIVVRTKNKNYKIKPFQSLDVVIIGAGNENMKTWKRKQILYLIVAFMDSDGYFRISSKIGTGFTFKERNDLYEYISKNYIQKINNEFFIKPKIIIEVYCKKYIYNDLMTYQFKNNMYHEIGKKKSVTLIDPRFIRVRTDKNINDFDIRLDQILNIR